MESHEFSLTYTELTAIIGVFVIILGALISGWVWVNIRFSEIKVQIVDIYARIDKGDKRDDKIEEGNEHKNALLSRELSNSVSKIFTKLDNLVVITTDIRIKCAAHDVVQPLKSIK
jgi:hypothetical protein